MGVVIIRQAAVAEQTALEALQRRASLANSRDRSAILAHPDAIALPREQILDGHVFVAESEGVIVGFAAVLPLDDGDAELDALFVEPGLWRHGAGRRLVEHCADVARTRGATVLHVVGNFHAEGFYRACGFEGAATTPTRFGTGLSLELRL